MKCCNLGSRPITGNSKSRNEGDDYTPMRSQRGPRGVKSDQVKINGPIPVDHKRDFKKKDTPKKVHARNKEEGEGVFFD